MPGIILIICFILLIILLVWKKDKNLRIPLVIAGGIDSDVDEKDSQLVSGFIFFLDWRFLFKPQSVFIGRITGESMTARGLVGDDIVIGCKVKPPKRKFNKGDLLIIRITDESKPCVGMLKIREFSENLPSGEIQTIKYVNKKPVNSEPHKRENVIAIVNKYYRSQKSINKLLVEA
jgi:hypothetical protein